MMMMVMTMVHSQWICPSVLCNFHQRSTQYCSFDKHFNSKRQKGEVVLTKKRLLFKYQSEICLVVRRHYNIISVLHQHNTTYFQLCNNCFLNPIAFLSCSYLLLSLPLSTSWETHICPLSSCTDPLTFFCVFSIKNYLHVWCLFFSSLAFPLPSPSHQQEGKSAWFCQGLFLSKVRLVAVDCSGVRLCISVKCLETTLIATVAD